jgi:Dyp-type peroxidase family
MRGDAVTFPLKKRGLDLADIQGNVIRPYGRFGFPFIRHLFFNIGNAKAGRYVIDQVRKAVTTSERWAEVDSDQNGQLPPRPRVAVNVGLSFFGLLALELPTRTLGLLPHEFIDGMAKRCSILGDIGPSAPGKWDPIWVAAQQSEPSGKNQIHVWISLTAQAKGDGTPVDDLETLTSWLRTIANNSGGVTLLSGHKGMNPDYQDTAALMTEIAPGKAVPTAKEHFGYTDGIGDPVFAGQYEPDRQKSDVVGSGKIPLNTDEWAPLATGEFILGHFNEAQELPPSAPPWSFMRSGTFMAYRKLHQNIASFRAYVTRQASLYRQIVGADSDEAAKETVLAKMVGRWSNGLPLMTVPTFQEFKQRSAEFAYIPAIQLKKSSERSANEARQLADYERFLVDFRYGDDAAGARCPVSAHIRRANPRDALDPKKGAVLDTSLSNRRRILRRGLPYGITSNDDDNEHGVAFMAMCASLFNQFEFIQQQWMNYGSTFGAGNDTDPIVGTRPGKNPKFVIPSDPNGTAPPFICANMPLFVETRGGEYFFIPSLTALHQIAEGSVDPT